MRHGRYVNPGNSGFKRILNSEYIDKTAMISRVRSLCDRYHMDFSEFKAWYDGYDFSECGSIYNPYSVMRAIRQIKRKHYQGVLEDYGGDIVLAGINYNSEIKEHSCKIERIYK